MNPDVAVVGGGAIGACIARELALRGARVVVLERGGRLGCACSEGNAGLICPSHSAPLATPAALWLGVRWLFSSDSPFSLRLRPSVVPWLARFALSSTPAKARAGTKVLRSLSLASIRLHEALEADGLDAAYARRGTLDVFETEAGFAAGVAKADLHRTAGMRAEVLDAATARELEPALAGAPAGAVHWPDEMHCDPGRFVASVGAAAAEAGAEIRTDCEVIELVKAGNRIGALATTQGEIVAEEVVLAAGAWTPALGLRLPVVGGRGYHVELEHAASDPQVPVYLQESWVIATPLPGRLRLAGTLELTGRDLSVDRRRVDALFNAARTRLAGVTSARIRHVWRGLRPCTPDGLPIIGRTKRFENVVLATGHTMLGITLAPVTGMLAAEVIAGEEPSHDLAPMSPDRFSRPARRLASPRARRVRQSASA
jgi:D-amino-acid dehydrogenase